MNGDRYWRCCPGTQSSWRYLIWPLVRGSYIDSLHLLPHEILWAIHAERHKGAFQPQLEGLVSLPISNKVDKFTTLFLSAVSGTNIQTLSLVQVAHPFIILEGFILFSFSMCRPEFILLLLIGMGFQHGQGLGTSTLKLILFRNWGGLKMNQISLWLN